MAAELNAWREHIAEQFGALVGDTARTEKLVQDLINDQSGQWYFICANRVQATYSEWLATCAMVAHLVPATTDKSLLDLLWREVFNAYGEAQRDLVDIMQGGGGLDALGKRTDKFTAYIGGFWSRLSGS